MAVRVGLGLAEFPFDQVKAFWRWVAMCDEGDIDSLWQTDQMVTTTPYLECMSAMAALAGATERIKFGMNVASVALRDPLLLAKQCATIDVLSEGRLLPAFGLGSAVAPEWAATGRPTKGRGARANEALEIIRRLWSEDSVTFEGKHYQYKNASISPRPVQTPMPLWIGGSSEAAIRRTALYGNGWQAGMETPQELVPVISAIKQAAKDADNDFDSEHYGAGFFFRFGSWDDRAVTSRIGHYKKRLPNRAPEEFIIVGEPEDIIAQVRAYARAGVAKFVLRPLGENDDDFLDQTRLLVRDVLPHIHKVSTDQLLADAS